jgi:ubiquinone/menaquinone biosynthesis C-methylase UbiE
MKTYKDFKILNIGSGIKKTKDAWNIDILPEVKPDEVVDITQGLPYDDNHFEEVIADYVLTQIPDKYDRMKILNEVWRVLKPNGIFRLKVSNANYPEDAFRDLMDDRPFAPTSFDHLNYKHYRWFAFKYGFKPWQKISVKPHRVTRLSVKMTPYKL